MRGEKITKTFLFLFFSFLDVINVRALQKKKKKKHEETLFTIVKRRITRESLLLLLKYYQHILYTVSLLSNTFIIANDFL